MRFNREEVKGDEEEYARAGDDDRYEEEITLVLWTASDSY